MKSSEFLDSIARGSQPFPRNGRRYVASVMYDGRNAYSYGTHYPLMVKLETARGTFWAVNDRGYSSTTARHIHHARMAAGSRGINVSLPSGGMYGTDTTPDAISEAAERDVQYSLEQIEATKQKAAKRPNARNHQDRIAELQTRIGSLRALQLICKEASEYQRSAVTA